ncbi:MAG: VOC family protein, partial [Dehalococcoidia bacterium]
HEEESTPQGAHSLFFHVGDTLVELARPTTGDSDIARHMDVHGPIVYSFTFKVKDLGKARQHARKHGLTVLERGAHTFELDPAQAFGGVFGFTDRTLPGHPTL